MDRLPPTATIVSATGTPGVALPLAAELADYSRVTSATLFYRQGGSSSPFASIAMSESPAGSHVWVGTVPPAIVTPRGVQYYLQMTDVLNNAGGFPVGAPTSVASAPVLIASQRVVALEPRKFALSALSFDAASTSPPAIFDEFGAYKSVWRYGTWDPAAGVCVEYPDAGAATAGRGFWVVSRDGGDVFTSGSSSDVSGPASLTLGQGWNQVGNPFAFPVNVADVLLPAEVESNFVSWNGAQYTAGATTLQPFTGYWVRNNGPGPKVIQIPPLAAGSAPRAPQPFPGVIPTDEPGWSVQAVASAGLFADRDNRFGVRPGATNAKDDCDFSDPPPAPEGFVTLALIGDDERRSCQITGPKARAAQLAPAAHVGSDGPAVPHHIRSRARIAAGLVLVAFAQGDLRETDLAVGALTGTVGSAPFQREWTIAAGTPGGRSQFAPS